MASAANGGVLNVAPSLVPGNHYQMCEDVMPGWNTSLGTNLFVPGSMTSPTLPNPNVNNMTASGRHAQQGRRRRPRRIRLQARRGTDLAR